MKAEDYELHAKQYLPQGRVRVLFIAEAPPCSMDRYFYFEDVQRGDWLWIGLMKALYPQEWSGTETKFHRQRKKQWLEKFANSGFLLIDAVKMPIDGSARNRVAEIRRSAVRLQGQIERINPEKIVLIKTTVHDALFEPMRSLGFPVVNDVALPFPSSGQQRRFHDVFSSLNLN